VRAEGYAPTRVGRAVASLDPDPEQCVARMFAGARVTGHVLDEMGQSVAAARIALKSASDPDRHFSTEPYEAGTAVSGTDGAFEIPAAAPGPSVLLVQTKRPLFVDGPFDVPPSGSIDRVIRLTSGVTLVGELQDASGAPLASEKVMVFAMEVPGVDHFNTEVRTDADGRFEASGLLNGLYQVGHVVGEGNTSVQEILRFVRVGAGRENRVVLRPVGDGTIAGTIAMKDGSAPPDRISVSVFAAGDPSAPRETTPPGRGALATDGRFQIDGVEPGEYSIHVFQWSPSRQLSGSAKLTVNHDRQDVRIELVDVPRR
jgi:hypothetical protein